MRRYITKMCDGKERQFIFYGAGRFAKKHINSLISAGSAPVCFADGDSGKHYTKVHSRYGVFDVLPLEDAVSRYPNYEIIVTLASASFPKVRDSLIECGIAPERISPSPFHTGFEPPVSLAQKLIKAGAVEKLEIFADRTEFTVGLFGKTVKIIGNSCAYAILENGVFEEEETEMFYRILSCFPENACVFDIGANIGYYSMFCRAWFPKMSIHAFEPSPAAFNALEENISLNNFEGIAANNFGLFDKEQTIELYAPEELSGYTSINNILNLKECGKVKCRVTTLDAYVEEAGIRRVDFIKCDVEGAELFVYKGGARTLEKFKPVVLSEILHSAAFGYHNNDILSFFKDIGYLCFDIDCGRLVPIDELPNMRDKENYIFMHSASPLIPAAR